MISPEHFNQIRNEFIANLPKILEGRDPLIRSPRVAFDPEPEPLSRGEILREVAERLQRPVQALKGRSRARQLAWARQIYCLLAYEMTHDTREDIGAEINRDRTTVRYSIGEARTHIARNADYRKVYEEIKNRVAV